MPGNSSTTVVYECGGLKLILRVLFLSIIKIRGNDLEGEISYQLRLQLRTANCEFFGQEAECNSDF